MRHDRQDGLLGRIELKNQGTPGIFGQARARKIQFLARLHARLVEIATPLQFEGHNREPCLRARSESPYARHSAEALFDRRRDQVFDEIGRGTLVRSQYRQCGHFDARIQIQTKTYKGRSTEKTERREGHGRGDGTTDAEPDHINR